MRWIIYNFSDHISDPSLRDVAKDKAKDRFISACTNDDKDETKIYSPQPIDHLSTILSSQGDIYTK